MFLCNTELYCCAVLEEWWHHKHSTRFTAMKHSQSSYSSRSDYIKPQVDRSGVEHVSVINLFSCEQSVLNTSTHEEWSRSPGSHSPGVWWICPSPVAASPAPRFCLWSPTGLASWWHRPPWRLTLSYPWWRWTDAEHTQTVDLRWEVFQWEVSNIKSAFFSLKKKVSICSPFILMLVCDITVMQSRTSDHVSYSISYSYTFSWPEAHTFTLSLCI